ncbi:MAG: DUF1328 domain-containing protein [Clostridiaceae bacterium]|nr:DUF1328 domain-containing protein [Clostridiaceae bacterium]
MIKWAVTFLVLALLSGLFGFGLIANLSFGIAKVLFYIFIAFFVVSLIFGRRRDRDEEEHSAYDESK